MPVLNQTELAAGLVHPTPSFWPYLLGYDGARWIPLGGRILQCDQQQFPDTGVVVALTLEPHPQIPPEPLVQIATNAAEWRLRIPVNVPGIEVCGYIESLTTSEIGAGEQRLWLRVSGVLQYAGGALTLAEGAAMRRAVVQYFGHANTGTITQSYAIRIGPTDSVRLGQQEPAVRTTTALVRPVRRRFDLPEE